MNPITKVRIPSIKMHCNVMDGGIQYILGHYELCLRAQMFDLLYTQTYIIHTSLVRIVFGHIILV